MRRRILLLLCFYLAHALSAYAQDCDALLIQGHRNIEAQYSAGASIAAKFMRHCSVQSTINSTNTTELLIVGQDSSNLDMLKSIEVEFFGYNKNLLDLDAQQHLERLQNWCIQHQPQGEDNLALYAAAQPMYAEAIEARNTCSSYASEHQILVQPFITPDARTVDIWIRSEDWPNEKNLRTPLQGVRSENFDCTIRVPTDGTIEEVKPGRLPNLDSALNLEILNVHCTRAAPKKVQLAPWYTSLFSTSDSTSYEVLQRGLIEIMMENKSLQVFFAEESKLPITVIDKLEKKNAELEERIQNLEKLMGGLEQTTDQKITQLSQNDQTNKQELSQQINLVQTTLSSSIAALESRITQ